MKKLLFAIMLGMASQANATIFILDDFAWTPEYGFPGTGEINGIDSDGTFVSPTGTSVTIKGSDDGSGEGDPTAITTATSNGAGTVSFDWDYLTRDAFAGFDPFVWLVDDGSGLTRTSITDGTVIETSPDVFVGSGAQAQSGSESIFVTAGSIFGFSLDTFDNKFGTGEFGFVTISNFQFDDGFAGNVVPVPPAFLLFGTALAGLGFFRKKKAAA